MPYKSWSTYYFWHIAQKKVDLLDITVLLIIPLQFDRVQDKPSLPYTLKYCWKFPFLPSVLLKFFIEDPPSLIALDKTFLILEMRLLIFLLEIQANEELEKLKT